MSELKACPLCGKPFKVVHSFLGGYMFEHSGYGCPLMTKDDGNGWVWDDKEKLINALNTRPIEDALREDNKRLRDALGKIASYDALPESIEYDLVKLANEALKGGE